mmetsp:Transcript_4554/g.7667  ORF Transcript_4554/g.7667 Transcript_4554/m.7667 type:complete len:362 (+) Transcript_4554:132-1217(+)
MEETAAKVETHTPILHNAEADGVAWCHELTKSTARWPDESDREGSPVRPRFSCPWCDVPSKNEDHLLDGQQSAGFEGVRCAEPEQVRLFNLDLHIAVIADVKHILAELFGANVAIVEWSMSTHSWVFGRDPARVAHVNQHTFLQLDQEAIRQFQSEYDATLVGYDGFVVTHTPVFALLFEKYGKPIIVVNSCRYDNPACWTSNEACFHWINERLSAMHASGQLTLVNNNKADREYLWLGCGIRAPWIPSLCGYTNTMWTGKRNTWLLMSRQEGCLLARRVPKSLLVTRKEALGERYEWSELFAFAGVVLIPYEVSTMTLFELYSANVPLIMPSQSLLCSLGVQSVYGTGGYSRLRGRTSTT